MDILNACETCWLVTCQVQSQRIWFGALNGVVTTELCLNAQMSPVSQCQGLVGLFTDMWELRISLLDRLQILRPEVLQGSR